MASRRVLLLHKSEWEKINRKEQTNLIHTKEYIKSLNEQSQKWIKSWSNTVQGRVCLIEKQKQIQQAKNIAFITEYLPKTNMNKVNHRKSIKQARELIFEDSCYGRQLLSALLESKTIEERNAQIEFKKKMKEDAMHQQQVVPLCNSIESAEEMEQKERKIKLKQREDYLQTVEINKVMGYNFLYYYKENIKNNIKNDLEEREMIKAKRKQEEMESLKAIEDIREQQERINYKIKAINNKIMKERNINRTASVYNQLKLLKEEQQSRYDSFIETGLRHSLEAYSEPKSKPKLIENKGTTSVRCGLVKKHDKCDRQCILSKSCKDRRSTKNDMPRIDPKLLVQNKLVEEYKKRQKQPSDWSGLNTAHAQFATQVTTLFKECQYKHTARKVVDVFLIHY
ncbi:unnamed protein product [Pieris brassicae]|uniref:Uncharacterized protein n=1 Tax=Pieris brassicae TaxID=7116 RepID=A0A9P0TPU0_PIEBR|nr:unnamed protein product [Pieris brassicae]